MKTFTHLGAYGLVLKENKILLIKKNGGPYSGKLDLPGGTIEFGEKPEETVIRELKEETGIDIVNYELFDANSIVFEWKHKGELERGHHIGIFYKIIEFKNFIRKNNTIDDINDDSLGAKFYNISDLSKKDLSDIAILELEKLGYYLDN